MDTLTDEAIPTCDICGEPQDCGVERCEHHGDWNGETGNHLSCEAEQAKDAN